MLAPGFVVEERRFLYHFLGQLMDAALCAALTIGPVRRAFWTHSPYHGESSETRPPSTLGRLVAVAFKAANVAAWLESRLLRNLRAMSAGVLYAARPALTAAQGLNERSSRRTSWAEVGVPAIVRRTRFSPQ